MASLKSFVWRGAVDDRSLVLTMSRQAARSSEAPSRTRGFRIGELVLGQMITPTYTAVAECEPDLVKNMADVGIEMTWTMPGKFSENQDSSISSRIPVALQEL